MKKVFIVCLCLFLSLALNKIIVNADSIDDEKIYCNATLDDNFSDETVCIILTINESLKCKEYDIDDFLTNNIEDIGIGEVEELTKESTNMLKEQLENCDEVSENRIINIEKYRRIFSLHLKNKSKENVLKVVHELENIDGYRYVGVDYITEYEIFSNTSTSSYHPNQEQNFNNANLSNSWSITNGSTSIKVGVLDTGIDRYHPDLVDNISISLSKDFTGENNPFTTRDPHGTHVAGIIAANGTVKGIAPNVTLVSLKIMGTANPSNDLVATVMSSRLISAIDYANANDIQILNFSGGRHTDTYIELEKQAIDNYMGLFVQAAGQNSANLDGGVSLAYPACYNCDNMIVVSGLNSNGIYPGLYETDLWPDGFPSYGVTTVDLFAPGTSVYSTLPNSGYGELTGTSMSAAFVSGTAALLHSLYSGIDPLEVKRIIIESVTFNNSISNMCVSGGRLNIYGALNIVPFEGSGTANNPYLIKYTYLFNLIANYNEPGVYFKQVNNINFENTSHNLHNITFKANYNGNNCYIKNIEYEGNLSSNQYFGGLFGINQGTIKNVKISGLDINISSANLSNGFVGGVVGLNNNFIENITILNSSLTTNDKLINTGGICGDNFNTSSGYSIYGCTIDTTTITSRGYVGGVAGVNEDGHIYMSSIISGTINYNQDGMNNKAAGGIIGLNKDKVSFCGIDNYSKVKYSGSTTTLLIKPRIGKVVGENWSGEDNIISCDATGILDAGNLNANYNQLEYVGGYYNGKVGLEEI